MLCVLLVHALFTWSLLKTSRPEPAEPPMAPPTLLLMLFDSTAAEEEEAPPIPSPDLSMPLPQPPSVLPSDSDAESPADSAISWIDWPRETRESAARVLGQEREAERIAKMFAGPDGTWASLTKRQRSKFNKFKWAPGVEGLERDENGNTIYRLPSGCTVVNFMFFGCPLGKPTVNDDMFENMRLYFDEQRLPQTNEGNGTEPESRRPPKWSRPLPDWRPGRED
jgi:hypothetical protein